MLARLVGGEEEGQRHARGFSYVVGRVVDWIYVRVRYSVPIFEGRGRYPLFRKRVGTPQEAGHRTEEDTATPILWSFRA